MSSSTEPSAVISTLVILLHRSRKSTALSRKTPCRNEIDYFWIRNIRFKSLRAGCHPCRLWGKSSNVTTFNQVSVSWLAFTSVIGLFEGKTPKVLIQHVAPGDRIQDFSLPLALREGYHFTNDRKNKHEMDLMIYDLSSLVKSKGLQKSSNQFICFQCMMHLLITKLISAKYSHSELMDE